MGLGNMAPGLTGISTKSFAVTPHNATNFAAGEARYLFIGGAGTVTIVLIDDTTVQYTVPAGQYILCCCKRVNATGTTATGIVGHL